MGEVGKEANKAKRGEGGKFLKGHGMGRPKGALGVSTRELRDQMLESLQKLGGVKWLVKFAQEHPCEYFAGLTRLLPVTRELPEDGEDDQPKGPVLVYRAGEVDDNYRRRLEECQRMVLNN